MNTENDANIKELFITAIQEMKKNSEEMKKNSEEMKKNSEEMKKNSEDMKKNSEDMKKNSEEMKQSRIESDRRLDKVIKKLDSVSKQLGDIGLVQGEIGEDLFYRNISGLFRKRGKTFDRVTRNLTRKGIAEYDIVAINGEEVFLLEVKNKFSAGMIDTFLRKGIPRFKKAFPEFSKYKIIAGVGALVMKNEIEKYAEKKGLYVFTQSSVGAAEIVNTKDFVPKIFT